MATKDMVVFELVVAESPVDFSFRTDILVLGSIVGESVNGFVFGLAVVLSTIWSVFSSLGNSELTVDFAIMMSPVGVDLVTPLVVRTIEGENDATSDKVMASVGDGLGLSASNPSIDDVAISTLRSVIPPVLSVGTLPSGKDGTLVVAFLPDVACGGILSLCVAVEASV